MAVAAIRTSRLTKDYGGGRGVFDLDLEVQPQQVVGLVGPNGAGKTTLIRCVMGMLHPTRGSAFVFGIDCRRDAVDVARRVGYVPGDVPNFGGMRGDEVLAYFGGRGRRRDPQRERQLAKRFELDLTRRFRESSTGDRHKLCILLGFMHAPELLVLDEPFAHLDERGERELQSLIEESRGAGATVFLADPVPSAVEHVCDRVVMLRGGRVVQDVDGGDLALRA